MPTVIDQPVLGELPMPWVITVEDIQLAVRAVVMHVPEEWPAGPLCRSDRTPYPCLLHRWARRVLRSRGLPDDVIDELRTRGELLVRVPDRGC